MPFHSVARPGRSPRFLRVRHLAAAALVPAMLASAPGTSLASTSLRTWFVAPSGSGSSCAANSKSVPFATIQAALACAGDGDVISLAPSGSRPYPGVGTVSHSVTIKAGGSGNARSVAIDLGAPVDSGGSTQGFMTVPASASVSVRGVTLECAVNSSVGFPCLADNAGSGSLVTNHGTLALTGVTVTGAQHGAAINNVSSGSTAARLTVTDSTIAHNSSDALGTDGAMAAGISSTGLPSSQVTVINSTIADNALTGGQGAGAIYSSATQAGGVSLIADTITGNQGPEAGGVYTSTNNGNPVIQLSNTVVAGNTSNLGPDCYGSIADGPGGHNLLGDSTDCTGLTNNTNDDLVGSAANPIDPQLAPVAYDGGSTETAPPLVDSPVIARGSVASCEANPVFDLDQRGHSRQATARAACDIGAADTGGATPANAAPTITSAASANATVAKAFTFKVAATGTPTPAISETGNLPSGVSLTDNGNGTATLSGKPAAGTAGSYPITITAENGVGAEATQTFTLTVAG